MHLSKEVVGQSSIIVQSAEVRSTHITDLKFLVARRTRSVGKRLEFSFTILLDLFLLSDSKVFRHGRVDATKLSQYLQLNQTVFNVARQFANLF
jgi:hypothetical protein